MSLLKNIQTSRELKTLSQKEMTVLAKEIRQVIVDVVSKNGGHLASSLGAVELAIALHYVFDTPKDKIIWDVGHQSYAHKLLTGRLDRFETLRQYGGLSGFTRLSESPHDAFTTGHSSTSISVGLGMVCGKDLQQDPARVVSVIGDGSMTAGLAYEGLNQAGDTKKNLIVILNDNDMSIGRNVGALSSFLSRTFSAKKLQALRREFGEFLKSLPKYGDDIYQLAKRTEESFKTFVTPGMLFEAFNFEYFGPINGHNLGHLVDILNNIKYLNEPVLLHVTTQKGKGYSFAEQNPTYFHGVGSFSVDTGCCTIKSDAPSYTKVFGDTMLHQAQMNPRLVAVTAAMPEGTGLLAFGEAYPDRLFDVGIAEQHGVAFAAGMAVEGMKPVVAIYSTFLQRAYDQIVHDVCIENLPVVFAIDRGGIVGEDGPTHHGVFDLAYLRPLPNMVVMAPKDENELQRMLVTAIQHDGPIAIRYPRGNGLGVPLDPDPQPLQIGQAEVLQSGDDVLILAIGKTVCDATNAVCILQQDGIRATLVNCRFVKPLDADLITSLAAKIPKIVTVEDNVRQGGFGSAVLEMLADTDISGLQVRRLGIPDQFVTHGAPDQLRTDCGIDAVAIEIAVRDLIQSP